MPQTPGPEGSTSALPARHRRSGPLPSPSADGDRLTALTAAGLGSDGVVLLRATPAGPEPAGCSGVLDPDLLCRPGLLPEFAGPAEPQTLRINDSDGRPLTLGVAPLTYDDASLGWIAAAFPAAPSPQQLRLLRRAGVLGGALLGYRCDLERDAELRTSEAELRTLIQAMRDVVVVLDRDGRYVRVAASGPNELVRAPHELVGRRLHEVLPAETADRFLGYIQQVVETGEPLDTEYRLEIRGRALWFMATISPLPDGEVLWVARDVTARYQAEEARRAAEARFRSLVEQSITGIYIIQNGRFTYVNPRFAEIFGYTVAEVVALPSFADLVAPGSRELVAEHIRRRISAEARDAHYAFQGLRQDGSIIEVEVHGTAVEWEGGRAVLGMLLDITDRVRAADALRRSENQLRQAQKMEAVGQLAGGIAHDFNNLLASVAINCTFLTETIGDGAGREEIEEIRRGIERAALLTRQLLAFGRRQVLQPTPLDPNRVVEDTRLLLRRLIGEDIRLVTELEPDAGTVMADRGQLEQVLMNLAVNARDAMPEGGTLTIRTALVTLPPAGPGQSSLPPGHYVRIEVSDTGQGMDAETQARIFEPFFTTKEPGKGTGLGLSVVHGIVRQSGGVITVASAPGQGTIFTIWLPCEGEPPVELPAESAPDALPRGTERILLVEDEASVRVPLRRLLSRQGYAILEAANGREAWELYQGVEGRIDLLLTDIVMPEMSGRQLAARIRQTRPELPVLFMSGYDEEAVLARDPLPPRTAFAEKPFLLRTMVRLIRGLLDEAPPG